MENCRRPPLRHDVEQGRVPLPSDWGLGSGTFEQSFDRHDERLRVGRLWNERRIECGRAGITAVHDEGDAARFRFIAEGSAISGGDRWHTLDAAGR